ncbi:MAG: peptidylprolyl isomerase [Salinivirgaceae bacterium]
MKEILTLTLVSLFILIACSNKAPQEKQTTADESRRLVLIQTSFGDMKVELYNETPLHRDNFIKLVEQGFYDSLLFHRVINAFMIQGGDPESKNAMASIQLGNGGPGYQLEAEFRPELFHKKGALAAAREPDQVNPQKQSSGSQFYIVQGKIFTPEMLKQMEEKVNFPKRKQLVFDYIEKPENAALKKRIDSLGRVQNMVALNQEFNNIALLLEPEYQKLDLFHYTSDQTETYGKLGGTPHLDQNYTVFGQVVEGMYVIDSIARVKTNPQNRPLDDIIMKMKVLK